MTEIEKIRAEIDKLYGEYKDKFHQCGDQYHLGLIDGLDMAERVLDTLESKKPINPDDAMKELYEKIALVKQSGTWDGVDVDKYMDEVRGREKSEIPNDLEEAAEKWVFENCFDCDIVGEHRANDAFIAGAKWQREQMMKEAVEVRVQTSPLNGPLGISAYCCNFPSKHPFYHCKEGDKVRVIVCKKED